MWIELKAEKKAAAFGIARLFSVCLCQPSNAGLVLCVVCMPALERWPCAVCGLYASLRALALCCVWSAHDVEVKENGWWIVSNGMLLNKFLDGEKLGKTNWFWWSYCALFSAFRIFFLDFFLRCAEVSYYYSSYYYCYDSFPCSFFF